MANGDFKAAIPELRLAILQDPTAAVEHRVLGQALLMAHDQEEALRELRVAVQLDPDSSLAHHYLGTTLLNLGQVEAAETEFREALRLAPTADNHYSLAACLITMGHYQDAAGELDTAVSLRPAETVYRARKEELLKLMRASASR